jgi:galactokinase
MSADPSVVLPPTRRESLRRHVALFHERFGNGPGTRVFFAPGRVNLMGAHLDYNGGPVMPMAIDRGTFLALRPRSDRTLRLASTLEPGGLTTSLDALPSRPQAAWHDYPIGVLAYLLGSAARPVGLDLLFGGNLAIGAGLSSSASICVGSAYAATRVWEPEASLERCVEAALFSEREFVGVQCGIMDPFAVGFARPDHLLWLDCKDKSTRHLPLDSARVAIAVADSGVRRELAQGAFNQRVDECARAFAILRRSAPEAACLRDVPAGALEASAADLGPLLLRRARHVVAEVARTFAARDALLARDLVAFGREIHAAHASLRDLFEVSIPELDCLVDAASAAEGVLGARLTGAGFGGCAVILLRREAAPDVVARVQSGFRARFGRDPRVEIYASDAGPREVEL